MIERDFNQAKQMYFGLSAGRSTDCGFRGAESSASRDGAEKKVERGRRGLAMLNVDTEKES